MIIRFAWTGRVGLLIGLALVTSIAPPSRADLVLNRVVPE
jgi:hypothetical protein